MMKHSYKALAFVLIAALLGCSSGSDDTETPKPVAAPADVKADAGPGGGGVGEGAKPESNGGVLPPPPM